MDKFGIISAIVACFASAGLAAMLFSGSRHKNDPKDKP